MIIILDGKGIGKGGVWYIDFEEAIEKRATRRLGLKWEGGGWGGEGSSVYRFWDNIEKWST